MENIIEFVKIRLNSKCDRLCKDEKDNSVIVKGEIFKDEDLKIAIEMAAKEVAVFASKPSSAYLEIMQTYPTLVAQGAVITILGGHSLLEKGREFNYEDNGIYLNPPNLSDTLMQQYQTEYSAYQNKLAMLFIK
jgi:hypothetical protein